MIGYVTQPFIIKVFINNTINFFAHFVTTIIPKLQHMIVPMVVGFTTIGHLLL
jgi:hypothetical protein